MSSNRVAKIFVSGNNSFSGVQHTRQVSDLLPDRRRVQIARQQIANILGFGLLQRFAERRKASLCSLGKRIVSVEVAIPKEYTLCMTPCKTQ
jgi:hypothetical protein